MGEAGYGMTEPFDPERRGQTTRTSETSARGRDRTPDLRGSSIPVSIPRRGANPHVAYDFSELYLDLREEYRDRVRGPVVGEGQGEIPEFAPAALYENNPTDLDGARLMCLAGGRETHFVAETILRRATPRNKVSIHAYSFDHPTVAAGMREAVRRGAVVELYMDAKYLIGECMSRHGTKLLADALGENARAHSRGGRLRVFSVKGRDVSTVYGRYDRRASPELIGAGHAKVLYSHPYLIVGSSNWSISSEANLELSAVLMIEDADTRTYVEKGLAALQIGAVEHFRHELVRALDADARQYRGGQSYRARTRATG